MLESEADRQAVLLDHDRAIVVGAPELRCRYIDPAAETAGTVGYSPAATFTVGDVEAHGLGVDTRIEQITRYDGRQVGPFRVAALERTGGGFVNLMLEALAA